MKEDLNLLITGGAGFIGSHVVEFFCKNYPKYNIIVMDSITYAADEEFFKNLEGRYENVVTLRQDITESAACKWIMKDMKIDAVIHLAAESHVDNSIDTPNIFAETNVLGTLNLLNAVKNAWGETTENKIFYHISTDEVYGHLGLNDPAFIENDSYDPRSPYSASKAASDHFVRAYANTYGLPILISNSSNNYGERQHREKLLPKTILNILTKRKVPIYGTGENIRDWIYVKDHVKAINSVFHLGKVGETYNIGGDCELTNIDMVKRIIDIHIAVDDNHHSIDYNNYNDYIEFVEDRKGHDFRYAINYNKITKELGWTPTTTLQSGLMSTYAYYKSKV